MSGAGADAGKRLAPAQETGRRFDPFRVLSPEERRRHLERYESHLEARNGPLDAHARRLPNRERFFERLAHEPVAWRGAIDREGFRQHFEGTGAPPVDARTLWLVASAKANQGESYGVDLLLSKLLAPGAPPPDPVKLHIFLEEHYHSRILVESCRTCGIDIDIRPPAFGTRMMVHAIYHVPERIRWPLILCGEVLGTTVFKLLLDSCHHFDDEPAVAGRLRTLVSEIWRDEVLHVAFLRAHVGAFGVGVSRALLPFVVRQFMRDVPQLSELGCDRPELERRLRAGIAIPVGLEWVEPEAAAA